MFGQDKHSTPVLTSFISYTFRTVNTRARAYVVPDTPESKGVYCSVAAIASRTSCARMNFHLIRSITVGVFLYYFRVHFGFLCFCLLFFFVCCCLLFGASLCTPWLMFTLSAVPWMSLFFRIVPISNIIYFNLHLSYPLACILHIPHTYSALCTRSVYNSWTHELPQRALEHRPTTNTPAANHVDAFTRPKPTRWTFLLFL